MTIEACLEQIGTSFPPSSWVEVSQEKIDSFAEVTGDHQYIHVDPEQAAKTPFGGTIAHGFLTLSLLSQMANEVLPEPEDCRMTVNYGFDRMRFLAPVPSGSRIRGHFKLVEAEDLGSGAVNLQFHVTVEIENRDKPALVVEWLFRRQY